MRKVRTALRLDEEDSFGHPGPCIVCFVRAVDFFRRCLCSPG